MTLLVLLLTASLPQQPAGKCVLDEAHGLSSAEFAQLETACEAIDKSGDGQIEIVLTDDFRGGDKEEFSSTLFHAWQIGHKGKDDGVLVVLSPAMRKWRIEVGYGLEGRVTDATASSIGNDFGVPAWKAGHWGAGLIPVVGALATSMHTEAAVAPPSMSAANSSGALSVFFIFLFVTAIVGLIVYIRRAKQREAEEEAERRAYLARQAMADYLNNPKPYTRQTTSRSRSRVSTPAPTPAARPTVAAAAVVVEEPRRYSDDSSSSYSSPPSYDPPPFDSGGFDGGGGGDSGGGGAGGDF